MRNLLHGGRGANTWDLIYVPRSMGIRNPPTLSVLQIQTLGGLFTGPYLQ